MSDPHGTRIAASAVGGAVGNYVGGKFDIKGANGLPDLTKSIVKNVVSGIASNVANQLTQIALDGKGKLSWTSVAVSGINGVGSGVEEKRRHDEIITQQRAAQGNTTSVNGKANGSNQAGGSISLTQARPMGVVIDNPPEAWDNVGKYNPNGLNVSWTDSPAQQNANNGGLNVTYPYDDNAAQKSITARKAAAATRKIVNANAQNFNVPNLDYIGLSGNVQNGTSVTLSSGLRRVSQQAVDYANLPKWSDRMPTTPAGTYRDVEGFVRTITPTSGNAADAMLKALPNAAINTINFIGQLGAVTGGGDYTSIPTFKYQNEALGMAAELAMTGPFAELAATSRLGRVGVAASAGIEAQFLTNSQRVTDESYKLFVQGIKDESIPETVQISV